MCTLGDGVSVHYVFVFVCTMLTHCGLMWNWELCDVSKGTPNSYDVSGYESQEVSEPSPVVVFTQTQRAKGGVKVSCRDRSSACGSD